MGPVVSWLLDRYSCRQVLIGGTVGTFLGFIVSSFSVNTEMLIITYGVITGASYGLVYFTGIAIVGLRFTQHRSLATGIALSGGGAGVLVMGYPIQRLTYEYGWRGTVLIMAALYLNCCVFAALIFPPGFKTKIICCKQRKGQNDVDIDFAVSYLSKPNDTEPKNVLIHMYANETELIGGLSRIKKSNLECYRSLPTIYPKDQTKTSCCTTTMEDPSEHNLNTFVRVQNNDTIYHRGNWSSAPLIHIDEKDSLHNNGNIPTADQNIDLEYMEGNNTMSIRQRYTFLAKSLSFSLVLVVMCFWTGVFSVLIYLPDLAISKGVSPVQAALLISMYGITNIVGRVTSGAICSHTRLDSLHLYILALLLSGIVTALLPHCTTFVQFTIATLAFGLSAATLLTLRTIVLVDVLGVELMTVSFGVVCFAQGICETIGPPISGVLFKSTKSFEAPFYLIAALHGVAGILCCVLKFLERHKPKA